MTIQDFYRLRSMHFSIMCESGAQWARIPIHKLNWQRPRVGPRPSGTQKMATLTLTTPQSPLE